MRILPLIRHAIRTGESESYGRHARTARHLADIFHRSAEDSAFFKWRRHLLKAEAEYIAYADWLATRTRIYCEPNAPQRLRFFWRTLRGPGYVKFYGASWTRGTRALLKDCVVALSGAERIRRIMPKEDEE